MSEGDVETWEGEEEEEGGERRPGAVLVSMVDKVSGLQHGDAVLLEEAVDTVIIDSQV